MALHLRKAVIQNVAVYSGLCFAGSMALGWVSGAMVFNGADLAWSIVPAAGIGLFTRWRITARIKAGVMQPVSRPVSYMRLVRENAAATNTQAGQPLDDYAEQLQTRGFTKLGDYTAFPMSKEVLGVAACFINASETAIVEVQSLQMLVPSLPAINSDLSGVHFSIASIVGGNIRVTTTDHSPMASNYLIRGDNDVVACYPGMGLFALLEKHERLLGVLHDRTGKRINSGLNMQRYILLQRECMRQARRRLSSMSGYAIARQVDAFESNPLTKWAPSTARLETLPECKLEELDASTLGEGQPPIMEASTPVL